MVTVEDISNRCFSLTLKYMHGPEHTKDLMELALLAIQHCQDKLTPALQGESSPYVQPWGGHE